MYVFISLNVWHKIEIGYVASLPTAKAIKFNVWKEKQKEKVSAPATDKINRAHSPCRIGVYALNSVRCKPQYTGHMSHMCGGQMNKVILKSNTFLVFGIVGQPIPGHLFYLLCFIVFQRVLDQLFCVSSRENLFYLLLPKSSLAEQGASLKNEKLLFACTILTPPPFSCSCAIQCISQTFIVSTEKTRVLLFLIHFGTLFL